ncbi:MAG: hypothetical protein F2840_18495 [Actinobacteria bacterium]|nr:hypothetical protein [Actinomycetota bacterium]
MRLHLAEVATMVSPGKHALLLLDRASWNLPDHLILPSKITIVPQPPRCTGLKPVENVWPFTR